MTTPKDPTMQQMNVYVPKSIKEYVNEVHEQTHLSRSDVVSLLCLYAQKFWDTEDFTKLAMRLTTLGPDGIEKIAS